MKAGTVFLSALCVAAWMLGGGTAVAGVMVVPARLEAVIGPDGSTPGVTVYNRGPEPVRIRFSLVGGGHDWDGMPLFDERAETIKQLGKQIQVRPCQVYLAAGEAEQIAITVQATGNGGIYPALVADIVPERPDGEGVNTNTRIAVPLLLTYKPEAPQQPVGQVQVAGVRVEQQEPGMPLAIEAVLANVGNRHVRTGARASIAGAGQQAEVLLPPVTILPGGARRLQAEWVPSSLPPGSYVVQVTPDEMPLSSGTQLAFQVIRPYELAAAKLHIDQLLAQETALSSLPVRAVVYNSGNVPGTGVLEVTAVDGLGQQMASEVLALAELPAGTGRAVSARLDMAHCEAGEYRLIARLWQDGRQVASAEQPVRLGIAALAVAR